MDYSSYISVAFITIGLIILICCGLVKIIGNKKIQKIFLESEQYDNNKTNTEIYYETTIKQRKYTNVILTLILIMLIIIAIPAYFQILAIISNI